MGGEEHAAGVRAAKMQRRQKREGAREKAGEAGMELETRGCGGRSGWQPVCVDASAVTVRADWRSQSVSQSARHRPRRTIGVHFSCLSSVDASRVYRVYTRAHT